MMGEAKATAPDQFDVAILGTGVPAVAAIINRLAHIAHTTKDGAPLVYVLVVDTRDVKHQADDTVYPLHGVRLMLLARGHYPWVICEVSVAEYPRLKTTSEGVG